MRTVATIITIILYVNLNGECMNYGSEFYIGSMKNYQGVTETYLLYISTLSTTPVSYIIKDIYNTTIAAGKVSLSSPINESLDISYVTNTNTERNDGIHLKSTGPISVLVVNWRRTSIGEYPAYPKQDLKLSHYQYYTASPDTTIVSYTQSEILLVGTEDNTTVTITSAADVSVPTDIQTPGSSQEILYTGQSKVITLNRLQTFLFGSSGFGDLTGTSILSNKPLTVISGHECANVPSDRVFCEHVEEQIPPTVTWGKKHLLRSYFGKNDSTYFLIVSSKDYTTVKHNCGGILTTLNFASAGSHKTIALDTDSNCYMESNEAILITQMMTGAGYFSSIGDPAVSVIPSVAQFTNEVIFPSIKFYQNENYNYINILMENKSTIMMDGKALNIAWESISGFNDETVGYSAVVSVSLDVHHMYSINGVPFHVLVYGYADYAGYSFSADVGTFQVISECGFNNGGCSQICSNSSGSFVCSCRDGFVLLSDGYSCQDLNECDVKNGGCNQICTNTYGNFVCSCQEGYLLQIDGFNCQDINECAINNGGCLQLCNNTNGSYICSCQEGFVPYRGDNTCRAVNFSLNAQGSNYGSEFYIGSMKNYRGVTETYLLYISTLSTTPISYIIKDIYNTTIAAGKVSLSSPTNESLDISYVTNTNTERNDGIHLKSTGPISVLVVNWRRTSIGEYPAYPKQDLKVSPYMYYTSSPNTTIVSYTQSEILLVGTEDDTTITITSSADVSVPTDIQTPGSFQETLYAGQSKVITLNRLQTFLFGSSGFADLTGTSVVSNKPLTVISGHECANVPSQKRFCEHVEEQIPPTVTWGKKHLLRSYSGKNDSTYFLIVSSKDYTTVKHNCGGSLITLNFASAGSHKAIALDTDSNCYMESNEAILITQMMTGSGDVSSIGDPAISVIPSVAQFTNEVIIHSIKFYQNENYNYINILMETKDTIIMDGKTLNITWESISGFNGKTVGYSAVVSVSLDVHHMYSINGVPFHVLVYGYADYAGYSFSAGVGILKQLEDPNECGSDNGGCSQLCTNSSGNLICSCRDGFLLHSDGFTCQDINECSNTNGGCSDICTNIIGSFSCSCHKGYALDNDGFSCQDVDECKVNKGGCSQQCINTNGSFACSCQSGFILHSDGFFCKANSTSSNICGSDFFIGSMRNLQGNTVAYLLHLSTLSVLPISYIIKDFHNNTIATGTVSLSSPTNESLSTTYITNYNTERDKGIHLSATGPISVLVVNWQYASIGEYPAYPKQVFPINQYVYYTASPYSIILLHARSEILLIGTEDNTTVMITPAADVTVPQDIQIPGSSQETLYAWQTKMITLHRLQTFLFRSSPFVDLTGTSIVSNKPLTVISGHECANVPSYNRYCEHVEEQIPPTVTWGKKHLLRSYTGKNDYTYFLIVFSDDYTTVQHNCGGSLSTITFASAGSHTTISLYTDSNCYMESNKPILITQMMTGGQYSLGDPAVSVIPPLDHYTNNVVFSNRIFDKSIHYDNYNYINIVAEIRDTIIMDGEALHLSWESISGFIGGTVGYSATLPVSVGVHNIISANGAPFHILVYGYADIRLVGYSFSAGVGIVKQFTEDNTTEECITSLNTHMHPTSTSLVTASLQTTSKNYILRTTSMEKATISSFVSPAISLNSSSNINLPPQVRFTAGVGAGIGITVIIITTILLSLIVITVILLYKKMKSGAKRLINGQEMEPSITRRPNPAYERMDDDNIQNTHREFDNLDRYEEDKQNLVDNKDGYQGNEDFVQFYHDHDHERKGMSNSEKNGAGRDGNNEGIFNDDNDKQNLVEYQY